MDGNMMPALMSPRLYFAKVRLQSRVGGGAKLLIQS